MYVVHALIQSNICLALLSTTLKRTHHVFSSMLWITEPDKIMLFWISYSNDFLAIGDSREISWFLVNLLPDFSWISYSQKVITMKFKTTLFCLALLSTTLKRTHDVFSSMLWITEPDKCCFELKHVQRTCSYIDHLSFSLY